MSCRLDNSDVVRLIDHYGSPLYIFHKDEFIENYRLLYNAISSIYPKYKVGYSFKTNYTPRICEIIKELGGYAEIVSDMEYRLAKRIGYSNTEIIYNGPYKGGGLAEHLLAGGTANIDSLDELNSVIQIADNHPDKELNIAFRVNIDIGQGFISRFGIDAYEDNHQHSELYIAFEKVKKVKNIKVVGLHCHIGRSRSIDAWKNRVRIVFSILDRYFEKPPLFVDFGSGMNSIMEPELAEQFGGKIPSFAEYADVLAGAMMKRYSDLSADSQPWLYTEPGTTLISGCMSLLGKVVSIKKVKGKSYVTFDCCGGNMGDICHLKNLPITIYHLGAEVQRISDATFAGYTCLEHDHIYEGFTGDLGVGDVVQFRNIGSYSNVFKPPFILPNCAMVQVSADEEPQIIKNAETIEDIFHTYIFNQV